MTGVVSFRPTADEEALVDRTQRARGLKTRAEAVRYLLRRGGEREGPVAEDPVFQVRAAQPLRGKKTLTSRDIDHALYGGSP